MGKQLIKGEKIDVGKINSLSNTYELVVIYKSSNEKVYDIDPFVCICEDNSRINKKGIIFYNNTENPEGNIRFVDCVNEGMDIKKIFHINFNSINILKLIIGFSIYKSNLNKQQSVNITIRLINSVIKTEVFTMNMQTDIINYNSAIIGEIYKYKDIWKFNDIEYNSVNDLISTIKSIYNVELY